MSKRIVDLTGKRFGKLTVISLNEERDKYNTALWKCQCDCGNQKTVRSANLLKGYTTSCGCLKKNDLTGKRFGKLVVVKRLPTHITEAGNRVSLWECQCDCGNTTQVVHSNLTKGVTQSCGCLQRKLLSERVSKHRKRQTRLYNIYANMKQRCYNQNNKSYRNYGGRGIKICDEWIGQDGFSNFYKWAINHEYNDNLTIDRIDVNDDYKPANCRWATIEQQSNNQRKTVWIEISGNKKSLKQWTNFMGWKYGTYEARHLKGKEIFNAEELEKIIQKLNE